MASKRKSVTFRENVSVVYPNNSGGSSSPAPITTAPATAPPSLELDPTYLTWLSLATKAQYPFIVNGTFAKYVYRQNFDKHLNMKHDYNLQIARQREAAVPPLAEKYGSLGWGSLYEKVTEEAWVKNYRLIYRFDGSDEQLLDKIAEAYDAIKHTVAEEETVNTLLTQDGSMHISPSNRQWEAFTQGGGALISPDFGPGGVNLRFGHTADAPFDDEESVLLSPRDRKGNGGEMLMDRAVVSRDLGNAMVDAGTGVQMLWADRRRSRARYYAR
ncbi:hypothetical protein HO173_011268 [Letharia columbiana]|uniref:Uncharacterized protein n=1 Tax=Letharia columbiana TaxID=112416 RepID=A0A8H6FJQ0_9LECA|nr:uncharacterized protein HO173_011268 [Letharia columbiana]KAF6229752.1 hypothetical protein HO173_011268 [Letharia columbiana]